MSNLDKYKGIIPAFYACYDAEGNVSPEAVRALTQHFIDCLGRPPEAYEHDMKLWWPHDEILIASLMIYRDTGDEKYLTWFERTLDYCKEHFSDPEYGDWYGYLRRDGKPTMPACKGSTFKGPFHLPRMLVMCDQMLGQLLAGQ